MSSSFIRTSGLLSKTTQLLLLEDRLEKRNHQRLVDEIIWNEKKFDPSIRIDDGQMVATEKRSKANDNLR